MKRKNQKVIFLLTNKRCSFWHSIIIDNSVVNATCLKNWNYLTEWEMFLKYVGSNSKHEKIDDIDDR